MATLRPTLRALPTSRPLLLRQQKQYQRAHSTVSANELSHFSALASSWWDPQGPSRVLHLMNPLRHDFIASCLAQGTPPVTSTENNTGKEVGNANTLKYLDIGCGGGIFAESLARTINPASKSTTHTRAASITALDPSSTLVQIARDHARTDPIVAEHLRNGTFTYKNCTLEDHVSSSSSSSPSPSPSSPSQSPSPTPTQSPSIPPTNQYDVVTLFEVIEHIDNTSPTSNPTTFLTDCLRLVRPGGWLIGSTISRTLTSYLINQVIAEAPWPVGVVPRGTHDWAKFVNPEELEAWVQEALMRGADRGVTVRGGGGALGEGMRCIVEQNNSIH
ncbi:ubiquinone biosynthesis O-methyltransferase [Aspergillus campestris IBT 28561]|uniref:Ubiquinone biosynthesis O-methyltransferase n=1 Tax=Aspergillus campestris (strain IBT 28561) TaxID=1392248 RepID=A0A2I1CYG1_ASPC2|nr:ubiquinone biosynthesis O-methyltransferase [Aspergillus campestris IBT 28561]PKY02665.1 ubiquinone biosynthesis O-methyltransferase [Aspergillus campestris IBT 28561]